MPVPSPEEIALCTTQEELFQLYKSEPYNWSRSSLEVRWLEWNPRISGAIIHRFLVDPTIFSCKCEGRDRGMVVNVRPTGVYLSCAFCRKTDGPLALDKVATLLGSSRVTLKESYEHLSRTNQLPPPGLPEDTRKSEHLLKLFR